MEWNALDIFEPVMLVWKINKIIWQKLGSNPRPAGYMPQFQPTAMRLNFVIKHKPIKYIIK